MIHVAVGLLILSATCVALVFASLLWPGAPSVDDAFITGSCVAVVLSSLLVWYVRRSRF